jgi:hypothetical protein
MESHTEKDKDRLYTSIALEIKDMYGKDQAMRERALANDGIVAEGEDEMVDKINTARLKEIIVQIGWSNVSKVGKEASLDASLLVRHADQDVDFQKQCLDLMKKEPASEVSQIEIAYLEDRVRVNEGRPQVYGTQFYGEGEAYGPRPIEDVEHVDERRKSLGMDSLAEYRERLIEKYRNI